MIVAFRAKVAGQAFVAAAIDSGKANAAIRIHGQVPRGQKVNSHRAPWFDWWARGQAEGEVCKESSTGALAEAGAA